MCHAAAVLVVMLSAALPLHANTEDYILGTGDKVSITVFGHPDMSAEVEIDERGSVSLPLVGSVQLGGLTIRQSQSAIVEKLSPDYLKSPRISVAVKNYRPFYILGEVKQPGSYAYVNGMNVMTAVAIAGGYTYRARAGKAFITRAGKPEEGPQELAQDAVVMPGDVIEIPERFF